MQLLVRTSLVILYCYQIRRSFCNNSIPQASLIAGQSTNPSKLDGVAADRTEVDMTQYNILLRKLYNINLLNPVKMGLENASKLYKLFGNPVNSIPIVHVAGTNGKGSVSLKIAHSLKLGGIRTGLFVSPHISSFRERIQVNGESMSEETVVTMLPILFEMCEKNGIPATFFELTSTLAFAAFKQANCEAIVIEVGLGGKLDSTNIITPTLCIITSIQLDHVKILGDTIEKIAMQKAGIMKPGVDVLVGPGCPIEFMRAEALRVGAPFYTLNDVLSEDERKYKEPVNKNDYADIDDLNTDIARAALRLLQRKKLSAFRNCFEIEGLENGLSVRPSCRFEIFKQHTTIRDNKIDNKNDDENDNKNENNNQNEKEFKKINQNGNQSEHQNENQGGNNLINAPVEVILDIAHNEDAMIALMAKFKGLYPNRILRIVLGMSADKDLEKCLAPVINIVHGQTDRIHCVAARHARALSASELQNLLKESSSQVDSNESTSSSSSSKSESVSETVIEELSVRASVRDAVNRVALEYAHAKNNQKSTDTAPLPTPVVIVCGTAFIMAETRAELGVIEPKDSDSLSDASSPTGHVDSQEFFGDMKTNAP